MSAFYDLASLVVVPSGYKSGKIYAQKPLNSNGELTFSRASTATRVYASGLIETVSSNVPRLDYLNSSCPRLLLEPQRTNLAFFSEQFDNAYWGKSAGTTITANTTISPDGYQNADTIAFAGSGDSINKFITTGLSVVSGTTYTFSVFTKSTTQVVFFGGATGGTGTNVYNGAVDYGNGWYRQSITRTWSASGTVSVQLVLTLTAAGSTIIYGLQAELGAYATSYIPTLGAAVTRGADAASKTGISSLIGQTEGTVFLEIDHDTSIGTVRLLSLDDGTVSKRMELFLSASSQVGVFVQNSTVQVDGTTSVVANGLTKIAFAYKANDFVLYINGAQALTDTSGTVPTCSVFRLFSRYDEAIVGSEIVNQTILFPTRLSNSDLAALTA